ncbi:unnamed protein product, partial [Prorocentrum cordatum]
AQVRKFYARCHAETVAAATAAAAHPGVQEITATDPAAEEYCNLAPPYRKKRLEGLTAARRCEVDDSRLPSDRLWGRYERPRRVSKEFATLPPTKIQSELAASRKPGHAQLQPGAGGVLAWRMPAIEDPAANSLVAFEEVMFIVENLLYLTGWVSQLQPLETFQARFWARARKSWTPAPGCRPLSLSELQHAFELFQRQWARASRAKEAGHIDDAVTASLPADTDELDRCLALAPRLQTAQQDLATEPRGYWGNGGGNRQPQDVRAEQPKGESKGKADRGTKRKAPAAGAPANKAPKRDQPCKFMATTGTCRFGDLGAEIQAAAPTWRRVDSDGSSGHAGASPSDGAPRGEPVECAASLLDLDANERANALALEEEQACQLSDHRYWDLAAGLLPDTLQFAAAPQAAKPSPAALDRALRRAVERRADTLQETLQRPRREPGTDEVLRQTMADVSAGKMRGPWRVCIDDGGSLRSEVPFAEWLPTARFPRMQKKTATSFACLLVALAAAEHVAKEFAHWGEGGSPRICKADHKQACRQCAVRPDQQQVVVCLIWCEDVGFHGGYLAFAHRALCFGATGAVCGYGRVASGIVHILRCIFSLGQLAFVDDLSRMDPQRHAALLKWVFEQVHGLLGVPLKHEKGEGPASKLPMLGMRVAVASQWRGLQLATSRRKDLQSAVEQALRTRALAAKEAVRLGGQLSCARADLFGRVGRAYGPAISSHSGGWSQEQGTALRWWDAHVTIPLHHYVHAGRTRPTAVAWVDGSRDMATKTGALRTLLLTRESGRWSLSAAIPRQICAELTQCPKTQRNAQSELLAISMLLLSLPQALRGAHLVIFEDNAAALANVRAGAAADEHSRALVGAVWLVAAALNITLWLEYVPSESNRADCFSRSDEAEKHREAASLTAQFDLTLAQPRLPASVSMGPSQWARALQAAVHAPPASRADQARLAAELGSGATDASTLWAMLKRVQFTAASGEITLGWLQLRRKSIIGAATGAHGDLTRVMCAAFKQQSPHSRCTTIVIAPGRPPKWPPGAAIMPALLRVTAAPLAWGKGEAPPAPTDAESIWLGSYHFDIAGIRGNRAAAPLLGYGFPL